MRRLFVLLLAGILVAGCIQVPGAAAPSPTVSPSFSGGVGGLSEAESAVDSAVSALEATANSTAPALEGLELTDDEYAA